MLEIKEKDLEQFLRLAQESGAFPSSEIEVLGSVLEEYRENPGLEYIIFKKELQGKIAGFVIFGEIPGTEFAWDIYWIVVAKKFQGQKIGKALIKEVEDYLLSKYKEAILRVETSGKPDYSKVRHFYFKCGFTLVGKIPDFYSPGDDLLILTKRIIRAS